MDTFFHDLKRFTIAAVAALALGIGANNAISPGLNTTTGAFTVQL
jgi:hypothetical protein